MTAIAAGEAPVEDPGELMSFELDQVQDHVERALFYARVGSPERDCILRRIWLGGNGGQAAVVSAPSREAI